MKIIQSISIACIFLLISCNEREKNISGETATDTTTAANAEDIVHLSAVQIKNAGIITAAPEQREMKSVLKANGVTEVPPQNVVSVSIPLGGYLKKTTLIPGAKVKKGSVLAILEDQQYIQLQQDYLTALSRLDFVSADYTRQKMLNETKVASDKIFQQARTEYFSQKILVRSLSEKLRLLGIDPLILNEDNISRSITVYSPIEGYVTKVNANTGKYINPEDILFELIDPRSLHVRLIVFENDAGNLQPGQKILCFANNRPEDRYKAVVHLITPNIGEDRSTEVHCELVGNTGRLLPGTFVNAEIELNNASVTAVPEEAVVKWENKYYVFAQEGGNNFRILHVETGSSDNGYIEIKSPIKQQNIVTKNAYALLMKMKNSNEE